jgi:glycosyltransferase involved in cell wall biosynthesis
MFSIVMTAYNTEKYLKESIDSILAQTYSNFELVIVENGSVDGTRAIIQEYAAQDPRVQPILLDKNQGIAGGRNTGLNAARYDWIVIQDGDDVAVPERLAIYAEQIAAHPEVIAWGGLARFMSSEGNWLHVTGTGPQTHKEFDTLRERKEPIILNDPTFAYRRDVGIKVGGYDGRYIACDIEMMDRMSDEGYMLLIPKIVTHYRVHSGSTTTTKFEGNAKSILFVHRRRALREPGKPPLTHEAFEAWFANWDLQEKRRWQARERSRQHWTSAGIAIGEKRYMAGGRDLLLSGIYDPSWIINRARKIAHNALRQR